MPGVTIRSGHPDHLDHRDSPSQDANDAVDMRRTEFFRKGKHSESVFGKKKTDRRTPSEGRKRKNYWTEDEEDERIGAFESHGRGVASKIMAKYAGSKPKAGEPRGLPKGYPLYSISTLLPVLLPPSTGLAGRLARAWELQGGRAHPPLS